jgi:hypothetical protein
MNKIEWSLNELKERTFDFRTPEGKKVFLTLPQARSFGCKQMTKRANEIQEDLEKDKRKIDRKGDGFTPGFQNNINEYITCPIIYRKRLKELGLVEIGYDYVPTQKDVNKVISANSEFTREAIRIGIDLSDNEINAIESGEYYKD